jgi:hypothetical protein
MLPIRNAIKDAHERFAIEEESALWRRWVCPKCDIDDVVGTLRLYTEVLIGLCTINPNQVLHKYNEEEKSICL